MTGIYIYRNYNWCMVFNWVPVFNSTDSIIAAEVKVIVHDNHGISVADCSSKCDALFDLVAGHDEGLTDRECQAACDQSVQHLYLNISLFSS